MQVTLVLNLLFRINSLARFSFRQLVRQPVKVLEPKTHTCALEKFSFSVVAMADAEWVFYSVLKS